MQKISAIQFIYFVLIIILSNFFVNSALWLLIQKNNGDISKIKGLLWFIIGDQSNNCSIISNEQFYYKAIKSGQDLLHKSI